MEKEEEYGGWGSFYNRDLYNTEISDNQFRFLCAINNLAATSGVCIAGNKHFAERFKVQPETVTRNIKKLEELGLVSITYTGNGTTNKKRFIRVTNGFKSMEPIDSKVNVNNNNINNNIIDKSIIEEEQSSSPIDKFIKETKRKETILIVSLLKQRAYKLGLIYKGDSYSLPNLLKNKDFLSILERKSLSASALVEKILEISDKSDFWKDKIYDNASLYRNWHKVLNSASSNKTTTLLNKPKEITEAERNLINNL